MVPQVNWAVDFIIFVKHLVLFGEQSFCLQASIIDISCVVSRICRFDHSLLQCLL